MNDKIDELHLIYKMIGNYGFCTVKSLLESYDNLQQELQRKDTIINELKESINNFDVFKEFTFPLMKRDEEQQVISSIDYEWRKSIKEPFLNKIKEIESK